MIRLTLVCHPLTAASGANAFPTDEPVDEGALADAERVAERLGRVVRAWTSPALRARQTAEALSLSAHSEPALADLDVGRWAGHRLVDLERDEPEALSSWLTDPKAAPHGGETLVGLLERVRHWLDRVGAERGRTVAVTHPAVVRAAALAVLSAPPQAFWRLDVLPLSVTILTGAGGRWNLRTLGQA